MQPLQAFDHPSFQKMIDITARATKDINIPNQKATRKHIIEVFKKNLDQLRIRFSVRISFVAYTVQFSF